MLKEIVAIAALITIEAAIVFWSIPGTFAYFIFDASKSRHVGHRSMTSLDMCLENISSAGINIDDLHLQKRQYDKHLSCSGGDRMARINEDLPLNQCTTASQSCADYRDLEANFTASVLQSGSITLSLFAASPGLRHCNAQYE